MWVPSFCWEFQPPISQFVNHPLLLSHKFAETTGTNLMPHVEPRHEIVVHQESSRVLPGIS